MLIGEQFDAVVECSDGRHQIVAQARAQQAGKVDGVHGAFDAADFYIAQGLKAGGFHPYLNGMGGHQTIDARLTPAHAGWRLDRALADSVPTLSRERIKALIRSGAVEAGGVAVRDPALKARGDERIRLTVPQPEPAHNEPQDIPLRIVFEAMS